jgi:hypothetical protein
MRIYGVLLSITAVSGLIFVGVTAYAIAGRFVLAGDVNESSLTLSVAGKAGSLERDGECSRSRDRLWRCSLPDPRGSGDPTSYNVRIREGSSCWEARRVHGSTSAKRLDGCVHRWQWRLIG